MHPRTPRELVKEICGKFPNYTFIYEYLDYTNNYTEMRAKKKRDSFDNFFFCKMLSSKERNHIFLRSDLELLLGGYEEAACKGSCRT